MTFLDATKTWFLWNILVTNHLHVLLLKVLSKLYMLPVTTLAHGYIHWAASKGERQYPKSPQRRFVQPQYLFCSQIKSEKGTSTLTLVPTGRTHTHIHTACLICSGAQLCPTLCDPMDCTRQGPLSMAFSRQEYWSGLPSSRASSLSRNQTCISCISLHWQVDFFFLTTELPGRTEIYLILQLKIQYLLSSFFSIVISFVGLFSLKGWTNGLFLSVAHEMKTFTALHIVFCESNQFSQPIHKNSVCNRKNCYL